MTNLAPIGLQAGERFEHPWGEFEILGTSGEGLETEYYVRDTATGEELWVGHELLVQLMNVNLDMNYPDGLTKEELDFE